MLARHASLPAALVAILGAALFVASCAKPGAAPVVPTCSSAETACSQGCTNLQTDTQNCGACGTVCASSSGQVCQAGKCVCNTGLFLCSGSCVSSNSSHCGNCATMCTGTTPVCSNNACSSTCATGTTQCTGGACANTMTDNANCGACGTACTGGTSCTGGSCTCPVAGQQVCSGACVDPTSNTSNCGSCGHACTSGQTCSSGTCTGGTGTAGTTGGGTAGTSGTGTGGRAGTSGGTAGTSGGGGKGGTGATGVDAGTDAIVCTNTADMSKLPIDSSGFVNEVCDTWGIQGAWYCFSDTTAVPGSAAPTGNGSSSCVNAVVPYVAASNGMCINGKTSTNSGAYGAAIGLELNTVGAINGVNQPKMAYNASSHNVIGFEITIAGYMGAANNAALRLSFTTAATTSVTQPFVDLPGPGTYDVLIADAVVPGSFADTSAGMRASASSIYDIQLAIPQQGSTQITYGYCITSIKPITAAPTSPGSCTAPVNYGNPVCGAQDLMGEVGNYGVQNNVSGTSGQQCIQAKVGGTCAGFSLTNPNGSLGSSSFPAAYPAIVYGWQAGSFYGAYKTAKQLSAIGTVPTSWSFSSPSGGQFDVSYDTWLHPTNPAPKPLDNGGLELMVWMNSGGGVNPVSTGSLANGASKTGQTVGTVPGTWDVYLGSVSVNGSSWQYLAYRANPTASSFTAVDLKQFFTDAINNQTLSNGSKVAASWYLLGIQAGFEVTGTSGGATTSYSVSVN